MVKKFNKKNVKKFARSLYEEKGDFIYYRPLCRGVLAKKNGEVVGCILGDLYEEFIGKPVARPLTEKDIQNAKEFEGELLARNIDTKPELIKKSGMMPNIDEYTIACYLVKIAKKKKSSSMVFNVGWNLRCSLFDLTDVNDKIKGETEQARIRRAKAVQKELNRIANEYLV